MEHSEPQKKGKSNAILTYETVAKLYLQLTELNTKFAALLETLTERKEVQDAHGLTIKGLDTRLTIIETKTSTTKSVTNEILAVLFSVVSLIVSAISVSIFLIWHPR